MKIALLTSSRADYGIYLPLLKKLKKDNFFDVQLIVFGTHLSEKFGNTVNEIIADGFIPKARIETLPDGTSPKAISNAMGNTIKKFSDFWEKEKSNIDLILCLGDRYEMFAAVSASVPFNIPVAHIHGGETTTGAIDNSFRHSITSMSKIHFASTHTHAKRIEAIIGSSIGVYNVGALSLDNLNDIDLLDANQFKTKFGIELKNPVLVTFHPETVEYQKNEKYINELIAALETINQQIVITMPNADTSADIVRNKIIEYADSKKNVVTVETFGVEGYFSCMNHCDYLLGNSSSGIIEAASFGKYVVNLGDRQAGREASVNVIHAEIDKIKIIEAIGCLKQMPVLNKDNIYGDGKTADRIIANLKKAHEK